MQDESVTYSRPSNSLNIRPRPIDVDASDHEHHEDHEGQFTEDEDDTTLALIESGELATSRLKRRRKVCSIFWW